MGKNGSEFVEKKWWGWQFGVGVNEEESESVVIGLLDGHGRCGLLVVETWACGKCGMSEGWPCACGAPCTWEIIEMR